MRRICDMMRRSQIVSTCTDWSSMGRTDITSESKQQRADEAAIECEAVTVDAPDDACRGITRRSVVKGAAAAVFALATVPLWRWVASPVRAYADESSDAVLAQAKELRNQLIAAQSQYYEAIARQEAANTQKADAEKRLGEIEEQLSGEQDKLGRLMHGNYVGSSRFEQIASIVTKSSDLDEMIEGLTYYNNLTDRQTDAVNSVKELQRQQEETIAEIERQAEETAKQAEEASQREEELQAKIAELQPQINEIADAVTSAALSTDKNSAFEPIMNFLTSVSDVTDAQRRVIESAMKLTQFAGSQRCEAWTSAVYANAGLPDGPGYVSAYADYLANGKYDLNDARPGMLLFGAGSHRVYHHVLVCISVVYDENGNVDHDKSLLIDNELARAGKLATWSETEDWFVASADGPATLWAAGVYPGCEEAFGLA